MSLPWWKEKDWLSGRVKLTGWATAGRRERRRTRLRGRSRAGNGIAGYRRFGR